MKNRLKAVARNTVVIISFDKKMSVKQVHTCMLLIFFCMFCTRLRTTHSQQRQVHGERHVGPGRVPKHVGVDVRAVRRGRVRVGQHGSDAVRRGQGRAGHVAPAPGRGGPTELADTVRGQQGGRAGRV